MRGFNAAARRGAAAPSRATVRTTRRISCVVVMDDGRIKMIGTPHEIFARAEELEAIRLDVPMSVRIALEMKKKGVELSRIPEDMETLAEEVCRLSSHM